MSTTKTEPMSEETYRQFALGDPQGQWELYRGQLREKPGMSVEHGGVTDNLLAFLYGQLDRNEYRIRTTHARLRRSADTYYIPDIVVIPTPVVQALLDQPGSLDAYPSRYPWSSKFGRPRQDGMTSMRSCRTISSAAIWKSGMSIPMSAP